MIRLDRAQYPGKSDEKKKKNWEMAYSMKTNEWSWHSLSVLDEGKQEIDYKSKRTYQLNG